VVLQRYEWESSTLWSRAWRFPPSPARYHHTDGEAKHSLAGQARAAQFSLLKPGVIGNDYLVLATVDTAFWKAEMKAPPTIAETLEHTADIKMYLDLHYQPAGWYPADTPDDR
jgi:hypothetical protein